MSRRRRHFLPTSVYLTPEQLDRVKACAADRGVTVNEFVRSVLLDHIETGARSGPRKGARPIAAARNEVDASTPTVAASILARQERRRLGTPGEPPNIWRPAGQPPPAGARLTRSDDQGAPMTAPLAAKAWRVYRQISLAGALERVIGPDGTELDLDPQVPDEWLFLSLGHRNGAYRLFAVNGNGQRLPGKSWLVVLGGGTLSDAVRR